MKNIPKLYYSGTSGLSLPINKTQYPAEFQHKSRLQYYASLLNSIEINSIFYKLPRKATVANWADAVPDNFNFTLKVSKTITHAKDLNFEKKDIEKFLEVANKIGTKKGCLLAQFPPSLKIDKLDKLQNFLEVMSEAIQNSGWKLAVEFRDNCWYEAEVNELLEEYNACMVLHDMPKSATGWIPLNNDIIYLRFHGTEPRYRGSYSDEFLKERSVQIKRWLSEHKMVYAYFNNTVGMAFQNLETLNNFVHS